MGHNGTWTTRKALRALRIGPTTSLAKGSWDTLEVCCPKSKYAVNPCRHAPTCPWLFSKASSYEFDLAFSFPCGLQFHASRTDRSFYFLGYGRSHSILIRILRQPAAKRKSNAGWAWRPEYLHKSGPAIRMTESTLSKVSMSYLAREAKGVAVEPQMTPFDKLFRLQLLRACHVAAHVHNANRCERELHD